MPHVIEVNSSVMQDKVFSVRSLSIRHFASFFHFPLLLPRKFQKISKKKLERVAAKCATRIDVKHVTHSFTNVTNSACAQQRVLQPG